MTISRRRVLDAAMLASTVVLGACGGEQQRPAAPQPTAVASPPSVPQLARALVAAQAKHSCRVALLALQQIERQAPGTAATRRALHVIALSDQRKCKTATVRPG
jgi:hypothetical protein